MQIVIAKKKYIRHCMGTELKLKYIPELRFYYDDMMEYAEKINKLIKNIHHDD